jgi:hypothetical protein
MRLRTFFFSVCFFLLVRLTGPQLQIHAQTAQNPGATVPPGGTITEPAALYLPLVAQAAPPPMPTPGATFAAIPMQGPPIDRPPTTHPDLNLAIRSYLTTTAALTLIDVDGAADSDAPQLAALFSAPRLPAFTAAYQVYDWNWACSADGCRGDLIRAPDVTLLAMAVTPNEPLFLPTRSQQIYAGGYKALVLYAEETRITLSYTREDTPARGYLVHVEDIIVDPALLALYRAKDAAGRKELPALRNNERFANASGSAIKVAIRDTGSFMDPRVRKNWWKGY